MYLYNKYIAKNLLLVIAVVITIITVIVWLVQSLRYTDLIVNSGINFINFLHLTILLVPPIIFLIMPITVFIGTVYYYNKLDASSELTVLFAAGLNKLQLLKPALLVAGLFALVSYFFSLYYIPIVNIQFKDKITFYKEKSIAVLIQEGVFTRPAKNITIYIAAKNDDDTYEGIFLHDIRNPKVATTITAQIGQFLNKNHRTILSLQHGNRQDLDDQGNYHVLYFEHLEIDLELDKGSDEQRTLSIGEMHLKDLLTASTAEFTPIRIKKMRSEAHFRIIWPFLSLIAALVAIRAVVCGEFSRSGKKKRIFAASLIFTSIIIILILANNFANHSIFLISLQYLIITIVLYCSGKVFLDEIKH